MDGMRRSVQVTERLAMTASRSWRAASAPRASWRAKSSSGPFSMT